MKNQLLRIIALILLSSHCCLSLFSQVNLNAGLVVYLPFNGNTLDASGSGNNAVNFGANLTIDKWGNPNSAYDFNGTNNRMEIFNSSSLQMSSITLCALVKPRAFYPGICFNNSIIDRGNGGHAFGSFSLIYTPSLDQNPVTYCTNPDTIHENYRVNVNNSALPSLNCITPINAIPYVSTNQWDCVIGVFNDTTSTGSIYVNGVFRYSYTLSGALGGSNDKIFIGGTTNPTYPYNVNGILDEIRIYNRALNTQEIDSICNLASIAQGVSIIPSATSICLGQSVTLTASNAATYSWSDSVINGVPFVPLATHTYTVTGVSSSGLVSTATITIIVNQLPILSIISVPTSGSICQGQLCNLTASGASTYSWTGGITNGISFIPITSNTYTVTGTSANGCTNTSSATITVNPLPTITANASPNPVCAGNSTTCIATGGLTYNWTGGITNGIPFIPVTNNTYTVTGTSANGCTSTNLVSVNVVDELEIDINSSDIVLCLGDSLQLTATGATTYLWSPAIDISSISVPDPLVFPSSTSTYFVTGTDANGCTGTASILIEVVENPRVIASKSADVECNNHTIILSATGASSYSWSPAASLSFPNSATTGATVYSPTTFVVTAKVGSCVVIDSVKVDVYNNEESSIFIPTAFSPNDDGKNDCLRVRQLAKFTKYYFSIYNRWGQRVFEADNPNDCWNGYFNNTQAPVSTYYYFLEGETKCGKVFKKGDITLVR